MFVQLIDKKITAIGNSNKIWKGTFFLGENVNTVSITHTHTHTHTHRYIYMYIYIYIYIYIYMLLLELIFLRVNVVLAETTDAAFVLWQVESRTENFTSLFSWLAKVFEILKTEMKML